jgi:hypothetical protein
LNLNRDEDGEHNMRGWRTADRTAVQRLGHPLSLLKEAGVMIYTWLSVESRSTGSQHPFTLQHPFILSRRLRFAVLTHRQRHRARP